MTNDATPVCSWGHAKNLSKKQSDFLDFRGIVRSGDVRSTLHLLSFIDRFDLGEALLLEGTAPDLDWIQHDAYIE